MDKLSDGRRRYGNSSWWILQAQDSHTASLALDALSTKFFGQANLQDKVIVEGTKYYTQALASLRKDLAGPEAFSIGTLAATSTLSMFELVTFTSHHGWIQHAGGLARLMQARGPHRHKSELERKIFLENRVLLISQGMMTRKGSFLSERSWKEVPWEEAPESKDPFDYLLDIGCAVPGMLEDNDRFSQSLTNLQSFPQQDLLQNLKDRVTRAFDELDAWWRGWASSNLDSCLEKFPDVSSRISFDEHGLLFDSVLWFESYWACYVTIFHNALRIILLGLGTIFTEP
ncbi:MAG: hypothetical protein LQ340_003941 [Diploschistes diacapsis]|nr:MAG: hypothetical protein LQ340_003941 [Diploschistes diacapsis]